MFSCCTLANFLLNYVFISVVSQKWKAEEVDVTNPKGFDNYIKLEPAVMVTT